MGLFPPTKAPRLRVIVPCFNTKSTLKQLLGHLARLPDLALSEVLVVDDGSSDGTARMIAEEYPSVQVVSGNGQLLWTGAIRKGMERALEEDAQFIFWLNHDCRPEPGAFNKVLEVLNNPQVGVVSGWCRIAGYPDYPVNPGFKNFQPLQMDSTAGETVCADGTNGNFVGFRADAVCKIGLPDAKHHPHYGDGPYTLRFSRAGFQVLICKAARADLDYELERRLPPFWRVAVSNRSVSWWLRYYFGSFKSQYNLTYRWFDSLHLRGMFALLSYPKVELQVLIGILCGGIARSKNGVETMRERCLHRFRTRWPEEKLVLELKEL
ncbi:MAG: glycosyltransferase family 2 protein [Chthoniobacteraceae bacterium]